MFLALKASEIHYPVITLASCGSFEEPWGNFWSGFVFNSHIKKVSMVAFFHAQNKNQEHPKQRWKTGLCFHPMWAGLLQCCFHRVSKHFPENLSLDPKHCGQKWVVSQKKITFFPVGFRGQFEIPLTKTLSGQALSAGYYSCLSLRKNSLLSDWRFHLWFQELQGLEWKAEFEVSRHVSTGTSCLFMRHWHLLCYWD